MFDINDFDPAEEEPSPSPSPPPPPVVPKQVSNKDSRRSISRSRQGAQSNHAEANENAQA